MYKFKHNPKGQVVMLIKTNNDKLFHLRFNPEEFSADYAILPGDPARVDEIASYLDYYEPVAYNREFKIVRGLLGSKTVFVCSTGIGGPSTAIAMEELKEAGVHTFIRVGTCGGINIDVNGGEIVIATAAIRQEGTSLHYAPIEFPAVADFTVTQALNYVARNMTSAVHTGIVQCKDSFYGQHSPETMPVDYELLNKWEAWKKLGVLASEMESAALFTVANKLGVKAGTILSVVWNQERAKTLLPCAEVHDTTMVSRIAVEAIRSML